MLLKHLQSSSTFLAHIGTESFETSMLISEGIRDKASASLP